MALHKNAVPILEYDTAQRAVIMPGNCEIRFPEKAVFLFLGDAAEAYAAANNCEKLEGYETITKTYPIFKTIHQGAAWRTRGRTDSGSFNWLRRPQNHCGGYLRRARRYC